MQYCLLLKQKREMTLDPKPTRVWEMGLSFGKGCPGRWAPGELLGMPGDHGVICPVFDTTVVKKRLKTISYGVV